jgi:hypothetical protein
MSNEQARYIAAYVNEELDRGNDITEQTILDAIDAFEDGAR